MTNMDHDRCSELLLAYVASEPLDAATRALVAEHLETCDDCSREAAAIRALREPTLDPLTALERDQLRQAVRAETLPGVRRVEPAAPRPLPLWGAVAGAAAALLLVAVGIAVVGQRGADTGGALRGGGKAAVPPGPRPLSIQATAPVQADSLAATESGDAPEAAGHASQAPAGDAAGQQVKDNSRARTSGGLRRLESADFKRIGERSPIFDAFATSYAASEAALLRDAFVAHLADQAPDTTARAQIHACSRVVFASQETRMVPVVAVYSTYEGRDVLALGFVFANPNDEDLDRFSFFAWPRTRDGEDPDAACDFPILSQFGDVAAR